MESEALSSLITAFRETLELRIPIIPNVGGQANAAEGRGHPSLTAASANHPSSI